MYVRMLMWSLRHRTWRHVLNAVTMALSVAVILLFVSVMSELVAYANKSTKRELYRMLVLPKMMTQGSPTDGLAMSMKPMLEGIQGAEVVQRVRAIGGRHPSGATYVVIGEEERAVQLNVDFFPVTPEVHAAWVAAKPTGAIVSEATARDLKLQVGQDAEIPTAFGPLKVRVVGLSKGALVGHRIAVHFEYLQQFAGNTGLCHFRIYTRPADYERVASEVNERTRNTATPAQSVSDSAFAASWAKEAAVVPAVLGFLGIFLVFTTALTLANSAAISIRERRTEMATLRVIGYRRASIVRLVLMEAVLVGVVGGILGIVVTTLVFSGGVQLTPGAGKLLQAVEVSKPAMVIGLVTSIVIPLAGALPSALSSMRVPLVQALRDTA